MSVFARSFDLILRQKSVKVLVELLPRILVSITPLLSYQGTHDLLRFIFENKGLHLSAKSGVLKINDLRTLKTAQ